MARPAPSPLLLLVVLAGALAGGGEAALLKAHFYRPSCPAAEAVVRDIVLARVAADPAALPARLLRLFFHDCFVRGCDASLLIDSTAGNTAEKDAGPNGSLGGFDIIDTAKAVLEAVCPGVVSCADIVALAARDAISFQFGRDLWDVQLGRRDGVVSSASEALSNIPSPSDNFPPSRPNSPARASTSRTSSFSRRAHHRRRPLQPLRQPPLQLHHHRCCPRHRPDPQRRLRHSAARRVWVALQQRHRRAYGPRQPCPVRLPLLRQPQARPWPVPLRRRTAADRRAAGMIHALTKEGYFLQEFKNAVRKMGRVGVLTGGQGEIRRNCRAVNS
ncbi:hypothetical protein CFC21_070517 [Triticum aestivum]|uniref:Peroxidase n=3 Tax=Triticum TaxID=4564 RepID=A0A9R0X239_TRITD|nr:hypothetical protein CFC21_070517 [Triticum aestivum]VAI28698.1 unnamed protein product [Triticum turgidum subsp. durum]